ncbi:FliI/YscN family ATPase [Endozoicomonas sp. SM1973]|uniref:FliI/YscN family ATPase n=1 Tax=Spartinivicinus marinus TaxID=2994442 RepID=A0A853I8G8_9GAMM|nr:FliI/YscN family ATPase [Spartinivicinus marinus]MCX4028144.1 FliI/YscN family ATPase [Spartinivicinus marinus]NYZ66181.1 FliI/YscN family ATPase [Spartinivicinus marinus]
MVNSSDNQIYNNDLVLCNKIDKWATLLCNTIASYSCVKVLGRVKQVLGTLIEGSVPGAKIGELCRLIDFDLPEQSILAEIVGFTDQTALLSALSPLEGVSSRTYIQPLGCNHRLKIEGDIFGQVVDGFGRAMVDSNKGFFCANPSNDTFSVLADAVSPIEKARITTPLITGIKSLDTFVTLGEGQRIGLFAGAGCGKTTLLASLARSADADVIIFALIGERGRELREFLEHELDDEILSRSIVICATSDRTSMERSRAAFTATAIAEGLRDQGKRVLLLLDSLTRFARAQREIGLAAGEPPARGGFPPSVYTMLPRLIERAGKTNKGSITAIYTILIEKDSMSDPIADEARSLLDGHIVLSRQLAEKGHYPAVDVLGSLSRVMNNIVEPTHSKLAIEARQLLNRYGELEMLIRLGEYQPGSDNISDKAVGFYPKINEFLQQDTRDVYSLEYSTSQLNLLLAS